MIHADELLDLAAEFTKGAGQFTGNVAAADDGDAARARLELKEAVRGDAELRARQPWNRRLAAGGDHDVLRAHAPATHLEGVRINEAGGPADIGHALGLEIAFVDSVQPQHIRIALALQERPIVVAHLDIEA